MTATFRPTFRFPLIHTGISGNCLKLSFRPYRESGKRKVRFSGGVGGKTLPHTPSQQPAAGHFIVRSFARLMALQVVREHGTAAGPGWPAVLARRGLAWAAMRPCARAGGSWRLIETGAAGFLSNSFAKFPARFTVAGQSRFSAVRAAPEIFCVSAPVAQRRPFVPVSSRLSADKSAIGRTPV